MIDRLYAGAASLAAPLLRLWLQGRVRRGKEEAARLGERRGEAAGPRPDGKLLWMHAASVGETVSLLPVLPLLVQRAPSLSLLLTTGSLTSSELLRRRLPELGIAERVLHRFVPLDVPAWTERFLAGWRPDAACFVEQEIWPNLLAGLHRRRVPVLLLNARLSARSAARWRRTGPFARRIFGSFARVLAQSEADAARLRSLGARHVSAPGNLKLAALPLPAPAAELERLRRRIEGRPAWLAASTHPGEEALVLQAHDALARIHPGLLTMLAPRHPGRGAEIASLAAGRPLGRRAAGQDMPDQSGIWIADTLGELGLLYRLVPIVFMGGSLIVHGGQNPLEAARLGCAVAAGPHTGNFAEIVDMLRAAGAIVVVPDLGGLVAWVDRMLRDPARRQTMGDAALAAARPHVELPRLAAGALLALIAEGAPPRASSPLSSRLAPHA